MTTKRLGAIAALIAGLVAFVQPAAAFKKREHEALSTLALAVALESLQGEVPADVEAEIRAWFLECSPDAEARKKACKKDESRCVPFGLLTHAVDKVIRPEGLIPSRRLHVEEQNERFKQELLLAPKRCVEAQSLTTRTMRRALKKMPSESEIIRFASCRAEKKVRHVGNWLVAVHQNTSHFEACAAAKYNGLHRLAIELAAESAQKGADAESLFVAFVAEAVALHFLQDSFAPGHLLTPRSGSTDIIARGMHNTHNRAGARVFIADGEPWAGLEGALQQVLQGGPQRETVQKAANELSIRSEDSASPSPCKRQTPDETTAPIKSSLYFGDGKLRCRRQALEMVLLSAASIREVLLAGKADPLRIFFHDWSAQPQEDDADRPAEAKLFRPWLFIAPSASEGLSGEQIPSTALASFEPKQRANRLDRFHTSLRNPELSVAQVFGDSDQEPGWRAEIALPFGSPSDVDIQRRDKTSNDLVPCTEEDPDACYFRKESRRRQFGLPLTWNLQGENWAGYDALGLTLRPWVFARRKGKLGWDLMASGEAGWKWYFSEARDTSRWVWGGHVAAGLGIVFLDLGFERGSMLVGKDHKRNSNYSVGLRVQIP